MGEPSAKERAAALAAAAAMTAMDVLCDGEAARLAVLTEAFKAHGELIGGAADDAWRATLAHAADRTEARADGRRDSGKAEVTRICAETLRILAPHRPRKGPPHDLLGTGPRDSAHDRRGLVMGDPSGPQRRAGGADAAWGRQGWTGAHQRHRPLFRRSWAGPCGWLTTRW